MPHPDRPTRPPARGLALPMLLVLALLSLPAQAETLEAPPPPEPAAAEEPREPPEALPALETEVMVPQLPEPAEGAVEEEEEIPTVVLTPAEPLEPPPLKPLEIMLDWYPGPQHAALLLAYHRGEFQRQGLDVTLTTPADPSLPPRLLAVGRIDLAVSRQPLLHLHAGRGLPLVRVGTLVDLPLAGLLLRNGSDPEVPFPLAGKRIGYSTEEARHLLLPALLAPQGIGIHELELVDINFSAVNGMVEQELDGLMTPQRLMLPRLLGDEGIATRLVRPEAHGIPTHEGLILLANRDRVGGQRETLRRVLNALGETTAWLLDEPEAAWELLREREPTLDTPANRDAWMPMLLRLSARPAALDAGNYRRFEAFLVESGLVEDATPVERLAIDLGAP